MFPLNTKLMELIVLMSPLGWEDPEHGLNAIEVHYSQMLLISEDSVLRMSPTKVSPTREGTLSTGTGENALWSIRGKKLYSDLATLTITAYVIFMLLVSSEVG